MEVPATRRWRETGMGGWLPHGADSDLGLLPGEGQQRLSIRGLVELCRHLAVRVAAVQPTVRLTGASKKKEGSTHNFIVGMN